MFYFLFCKQNNTIIMCMRQRLCACVCVCGSSGLTFTFINGTDSVKLGDLAA